MTITDHALAVLREPSPEILQWDSMACETACTAQLLYMHGLLDVPFSQSALDRRIGREPGCGDLRSGNLELLLESGFEVRQISPADPYRIVESMDYVRELWLKDGDTPEFIAEHLPGIYPGLRARIQCKIEIARRYASRYSHDLRDTTWADLEALVDAGYAVSCETESESGNSHQMLVTRRISADMFEVYEPDCGVTAYDSGLADCLLSGFVGYRLH